MNRCNICGQFKKWINLLLVHGEDSESWLECKDCMCESDYKIWLQIQKDKNE